MTSQNATLSVYYDGLCPLCSKEIDHYRKQVGSNLLSFIDITEPTFNATAHGLDPMKVHKVMHVKTSDGVIHTEVDAFINIWKILPNYKWLSVFAQKKYVRPFLNVGYTAFATVRPYLPRKNKADCEQSPYCDLKKK